MMSELVILAALLPVVAYVGMAMTSKLTKSVQLHKRLIQGATWTAIAAALVAITGLVSLGPIQSNTLGWEGLGLAIRLDALSVIMISMISILALIIVRYSCRYLEGDQRQSLFLGRLALTIASVSLLVMSGNLVLMVLSWIALSLSLHSLLVFYPERRKAQVAAKKKFIISRAGDVALIGAAGLIYWTFGTGDLGAIFSGMAAVGMTGVLEVAMALIALAAILKSAQFPTHGWLVEVMETPTPVSALLHAGILNAGPFLVVRMAFLMQESLSASIMLIVFGGTTALIASIILLTQPSIKVNLGYSSAAHMGFMLMVCGLGLYSAVILHLVAHSFYKAHAFLASGSVIDQKRASYFALPERLGSPSRLLLSLLAASVCYAAFSWVWGINPFAQPALLVIGIILVMGLAQIMAPAVDSKGPVKAMGITAGLAAFVATLFFSLELVTHKALYGAIPELASMPIAIAILSGIVLLAFGITVLIQMYGVSRVKSTTMQAWGIHLRNGLYANAWMDRLVGAMYQEPTPLKHQVADSSDSGAMEQLGTLDQDTKAITPEEAKSVAGQAAGRIAPLWPLESFVAVNPYLGMSEMKFHEADARMNSVADADNTMDQDYYLEMIREGRIQQSDINDALQAYGHPLAGQPEDFIDELKAHAKVEAVQEVIPTVASTAQDQEGLDYPAMREALICDWIACYLDEGGASWNTTRRDLSIYSAWKHELHHSKRAAVLGMKGLSKASENLPDDPEEMIAEALNELDIPSEARELYLHRLMMTVGGWSAYIARLDWDKKLYDLDTQELIEFQAVLVSIEVLIARHKLGPAWVTYWEHAKAQMLNMAESLKHVAVTDTVILQKAYEMAYQRELVASIQATEIKPESEVRPAVQAVFCIDVRSEVFRRHFESVSPGVQTFGFAGFFGVPLAFKPLGHTEARAQCPVLLAPQFTIEEKVDDEALNNELTIARTMKHHVARAWYSFKNGAISCFSFVGPVGLLYLPKMITDGFGWTRPCAHPDEESLGSEANAERKPQLHTHESSGGVTGLSLKTQIDMAKGILKGMSLTENFAPVVMMMGHGSSTVNNPHGTGLDCGACGGNTGQANAQIATEILNQPEVRLALVEEGIKIPADTIFLAALHDTTTDKVTIFGRKEVPASHEDKMSQIESWLKQAGIQTRVERAMRFDIDESGDVHTQVIKRSKDWSQTRPEWGLAGCSAFVVAPRSRTSQLELGGKSFLHSYDWENDEGFGVLELIMTAPMIVTSWINLQYYGSMVDNRVYGAGNKTLHNVVGRVGVQEGNGGDLRVGLPMQSIHDGEKYQHDPLKLSVVIEAPLHAIQSVIEKHKMVSDLVTNDWITILAVEDEQWYRWGRDAQWHVMGEDLADVTNIETFADTETLLEPVLN